MIYTGPGVLIHKGRDYCAGDELPADLPAETVQSLAAKGYVDGEGIVRVCAECATRDAEIERLNGVIAELTTQLTASPAPTHGRRR